MITKLCLSPNLLQNAVLQRPWGIQAIKFITSTSLVLLMMNLTPAEKSKSIMGVQITVAEL